MNIVISGIKHTGKTTAASTLIELLKANGKTVSGFLCPEDKIINVATGETKKFLYREFQPDAQVTGPFWIPEDALAFGALAASKPADFVFIDEYGKLELHEQGCYPALKEAWKKNNCVVLLKDINLKPFIERFGECKTYMLTVQNRDSLPDEIYKDIIN